MFLVIVIEMEYVIEFFVVIINKIVNKRNVGLIILESGNCFVIVIIVVGILDLFNVFEIDLGFINL